MPEATWEPREQHGRLTRESDLEASVHAFRKQRKEPLTGAEHVSNAVTRFGQGTSSMQMANWRSRTSKKVHRSYGVNLSEASWRDPGIRTVTSSMWGRAPT